MSKMKHRPKLGRKSWGALLPVRKGLAWQELQAITQFQRNKARSCGGRRR
jgi:hypothetical protein